MQALSKDRVDAIEALLTTQPPISARALVAALEAEHRRNDAALSVIEGVAGGIVLIEGAYEVTLHQYDVAATGERQWLGRRGGVLRSRATAVVVAELLWPREDT